MGNIQRIHKGRPQVCRKRRQAADQNKSGNTTIADAGN